MENSLQVFNYEGCPITFQTGDGVMVNATEMAKMFEKRAVDWLRLPSTQEYIEELSIVRKSHNSEYQPVITKVGAPETGGGTWMHEDVALEFARWLSPKFAIWCNDRIKELLTTGMTFINDEAAFYAKALLMANDKMKLLAADNQAKSQELVYTKSELNQQISDNYRLRSNNKFHEKVNESLREENRAKDERIGVLEPKGEYYDKYMNADGWFTATEVASEIGVSPQKLNAWLNKNGWIKKGSHDWLPTVDFIELNKKYDGGLYKIFPVVYSYGGKDYTRQQLRYSRYFKDLLVERYRKNKQQAV